MGICSKKHQDLEIDVNRSRKCTDCLCCLLLVLTWIAMSVLGFGAMGWLSGSDLYESKLGPYIAEGNTDILIHGEDSNGYVCGSDKQVKDEPYLYFPNPSGYNIQSTTGEDTSSSTRICVQSCPDSTSRGSSCETVSNFDDTESWCQIETFNFGYYCIATNLTKASNNFAFEIVYDLYDSWKFIVLIGFVGAMLSSFLYVAFLRIPCMLRAIVWTCLLGVLAVLVSGAYYFYKSYEDISSADEDDDATMSSEQRQAYKIMSFVLMGLAGLWCALIFCLFQQIEQAIHIVVIACKAILSMPSITLLPLIQLVAMGIFSSFWFVYLITVYAGGFYLADDDGSAGADTSGDQKEYATYEIWFLVFVYYWTVEWIFAIGQITVSMATFYWYFDSEGQFKGRCGTPLGSFGTTLRYHSGTAAMGAFVIALVKLFRYMLRQIQKLANKDHTGCVKYPVKAVLCCCQCCLYCLEKCLDFVTRQAYIQCAIHGTGFWSSAGRAFTIIMQNIRDIGAVTIVGDFVIFIGQALVTVFCSAVGYYYFSTFLQDELYGVTFPTLAVLVLAFCTSMMFTMTMGMVIDSLLMCYIEDRENNHEETRQNAKSKTMNDCVQKAKRSRRYCRRRTNEASTETIDTESPIQNDAWEDEERLSAVEVSQSV